MSDELLESNIGLYNFTKNEGKVTKLSKSPEEILKSGMKDRVSYVTSEIDIQKDVKPCAIGLLYRPGHLSKKELKKLFYKAEDIGVPLIVYDYQEIKKSLQKDKNAEKNKSDSIEKE